MERQDHPTATVPAGEQPHQYPGPQQAWTAPPPGPAEPERPSWSRRRTGVVTAAAAAAVLAVGGVAVAHSGGDSGSSSTAQGPGGGFPGGGQGFPGGGPGFPGGGAQTGLAGALHGTFVTRSGSTYVTQLMQTGTVSAVSATSISVTSADGYAKTYAIASSTTVDGGQAAVGDIATGATVTVIASEAGVATAVLDQSLATTGQGGQGGQSGQSGQGGQGGQGGFPGGGAAPGQGQSTT